MESTNAPTTAAGRRRPGRSGFYKELAGFRHALRRFLAFSDVAAQTVGITSQQYQAMLAIAASDGEAMTMKELAEEMLLKPNGAVQLIDRLEGLGLVSRAGSEGSVHRPPPRSEPWVATCSWDGPWSRSAARPRRCAE